VRFESGGREIVWGSDSCREEIGTGWAINSKARQDQIGEKRESGCVQVGMADRRVGLSFDGQQQQVGGVTYASLSWFFGG
jgi:hypothetical protein